MDKKKITFLGKEVTISYNMATQIAYEEISGAPFDPETLSKTSNTLVLYYACIIANNPDTTITFDDMLLNATASDIKVLRDAVLDSFAAWCKTVTKDEPTTEDDGKNV